MELKPDSSMIRQWASRAYFFIKRLMHKSTVPIKISYRTENMQRVTRNKAWFTNFSLNPRFGYYFAVLTYGMINETGIPHAIHGNSMRTVQRVESDCNVPKALLLTSTNINPEPYFVRDNKKIRFLSLELPD